MNNKIIKNYTASIEETVLLQVIHTPERKLDKEGQPLKNPQEEQLHILVETFSYGKEDTLKVKIITKKVDEQGNEMKLNVEKIIEDLKKLKYQKISLTNMPVYQQFDKGYLKGEYYRTLFENIKH